MVSVEFYKFFLYSATMANYADLFSNVKQSSNPGKINLLLMY